MNYYLLFKSLHLISVISWMAGLLYLPRLFVYHAETQKNEGQKETFKLMEKRLFLYIMNPAMILSWLFGVLLIYSIGVETFVHLWLQLKLAMVILLTFYHFFLFHCLKNFTQNNSKYSPKFYRIINEVPTLLLVGIIFIVVFKPL
jgi:putative membrane protein